MGLSSASALISMEIMKENTTDLPADLPADILIAIFTLCSTSNGTVLPPKFDEAQWSFTRVCSNWRKVGLEAWWHDIRFHWIPTGPLARKIAALQAHMVEQTTGRPLSISNSAADMALYSLNTMTTFFMNNYVIPYAAQLGRLKYEGGPSGVRALFKLPSGSLPLLEELNLEIRVWDNRDTTSKWRKPSVTFQQSKSLRRVTFGGRYLVFDPTLMNLPWTQLESLAFGDIETPSKSLHEFLPACGRLTNLRIDTSWRLSNDVPIILPSVISFDGTVGRLTEELLAVLKFPKLRFLTIRVHTPDWTQDGFKVFASGSCRDLEGLCLVITQLSQPEVKVIVDNIIDELSPIQPPIIDCRLLCSAITSETLARFGSGAFPALRYIMSDASSPDIVSGFLDAVESLHRDFGKLERATVSFREELGQEAIAKVERLRSKGVGVRLCPFAPNWGDDVRWQ